MQPHLSLCPLIWDRISAFIQNMVQNICICQFGHSYSVHPRVVGLQSNPVFRKVHDGRVAMCRNTWLHWNVDFASQANIIALGFHGTKLFGEDLDPSVVETKRKQKLLPTKAKHSRPSQKQQQW